MSFCSSLGWTGKDRSGGLHKDSDKSRAAWGPRAPVVALMPVEVQTCSIVLVVSLLPLISGFGARLCPADGPSHPYGPALFAPAPPSQQEFHLSSCQPSPQGKAVLRRSQSQDFIHVSALGLLAALSGCDWLTEMS